MTHIPPPHGSSSQNYPQHGQHPSSYPDPSTGPSTSSPGTPPGGLPSPSFLPPNHPNAVGVPGSMSSTQAHSSSGQPTDRNTTSLTATALLSSFPPYSHLSTRISQLKTELDALNARQRIWRRLAHAAVLFSSDHELRYSLLDKCNDLAECIKSASTSGGNGSGSSRGGAGSGAGRGGGNREEKQPAEKLREEVGKMNEVELQLFSISSTAKQLLQDAEWVRAEDIRAFVEGVRAMGGMVRVEGPGHGGEVQMVQVRLERGRGDVGRRLNYLMVTPTGGQGGGQVVGGGGGGGVHVGQGEGSGMLGEGGSRRSSTTAAARTGGGRGQQQQPTSQVQSYLAAQAVAAVSASRPQSQAQQHTQHEETGHGWSPANASAASSAGRASPGPSEASSTGPPGHGPNRARWWDTVITDSDTDQRRRLESSRNLPLRGQGGDSGSDCEMEM